MLWPHFGSDAVFRSAKLLGDRYAPWSKDFNESPSPPVSLIEISRVQQRFHNEYKYAARIGSVIYTIPIDDFVAYYRQMIEPESDDYTSDLEYFFQANLWCLPAASTPSSLSD